jgi:Holliday junction DNA helicase RuvA
MYTAFIGELVSGGLNPVTNDPFFVLNVQQHLYELRCTERFLMSIKTELGQTRTVYTHLTVKEEELSLTGFPSPEERDMFRILIGASGVGAKVALSILNTFEAPTLMTFILNEDVKAITTVKGVGPKVAQRIILDVKEKLKAFVERTPHYGRLTPEAKTASTIGQGEALSETLSVLDSLGYEAHEIEKALMDLRQNEPLETLASSDAETLLRLLLKRL